MKTTNYFLMVFLLSAVIGCSKSTEMPVDSETETDSFESRDTMTDGLDTVTDIGNDSDSGTSSEEGQCSVAFSDIVFSFPNSSFCSYKSYASDIHIDVTAENDRTFTIGNNTFTANCEKSGCVFTCFPLDLIWVDIDGYDPETGQDIGAGIEYAVELSGEMQGDHISNVTAAAIVTCSGQLCTESNCREDISDTVSWE